MEVFASLTPDPLGFVIGALSVLTIIKTWQHCDAMSDGNIH